MTDVNLRVLLSAAGGAGVTSMIGQVAQAFTGKNGMANGLKAVGVAAAAMGVTAAVAIGVQAVQAASTFQAGITSLSTGAGELQSNLGMVSDGILNLATSTGTSTKQLTDGMFMIESAGYHGAAGLAVLKTAAEGAKVGNADLGTTADAVTTIMKDYGIKAANSADAMNFLTAIVSNGKTHMQDLASAMAAILPTSSAVGVSLNDVGGAMATMTGEGVPAANAATYLRQMLISLSSPATAGAKSLAAIGLTSQQVSDDMKKSLPDTLNLIMTRLGETYKVGSPQYVTALKNISGGSRQMQGMLDLTGTHLKTFGANVASVGTTVNKGKGSVTGWNQVTQEFSFKMDQAKEAGETFLIKLGTALIPIIINGMTAIQNLSTWVGNVANKFTTWVQKSGILQSALNIAKGAVQGVKNVIQGTISVVMSIVNWFIQWRVPILAVASAITLFILPALIQMGVQAAITGAQAIGGLISQLIALAAQAGTAGLALITDTIPALISMAAQAIVTAATAIPGLVMGFIAWAAAGWTAAAATIAATWPILLIIAAIALLVVGIILLATHWTQVTTWIGQQMSRLGGFVHLQVVLIGAIFSWLGTQVHNIISTIGDKFSEFGSHVHDIVFGILGWFQALPGNVVTAITNLTTQGKTLFQNFWHTIVSDATSILSNIGSAIGNAFKAAINNLIINPVNTLINGINNVTGKLHIPAIPHIPQLASGGTIMSGGLALVGENGPELVGLPSGATVYPHGTGPASYGGYGGYGGGLVINLYISTMAGSPSEIRRMANLIQQELARQFRATTPGYAAGGLY